MSLAGRNVRILAQSFVNKSVRFNSSLVNLDIKDSVAVMELNRKPVNSFSMDFIEEITSSLQGLEKNSDVRGLILTSVSLFEVVIFNSIKLYFIVFMLCK